ncbi:MAG: replication-relaxation family protein [Dehalococcoidia bacterium]|nr:replication-relaxation family protein [Dehalococcoidia bacterium]
MATEFDARHSESLAWVLRLPFVSASQLALLLGDREAAVNAGLRSLDRQGWLDWVDSPVPDAEAARLYVLTDEARKWVGERLAAGAEAFPLPHAHNEILHRFAGIEATIAFNRFVAELGSACRRDPDLQLSEALSLPVRRREAWWPPGVHGLGVLQHRGRTAPLFVAIDHLAAPAVHRAATVAGWYAHRDSGRRSSPDAPIIVLAPDARAAEEWKQAVVGTAERRGVLPLVVLVAQRGTGLGGNLLAGLRWRAQPSTCQPITSNFDGPPETLPRSVRLHEWARQALGDTPARARRAQRERVAALSLFASPEQVKLLETVGRLPLLPESDLGLVRAVPPPLLRRQLERAQRNRLVQVVVRPNGQKHFVLGEFGLRLLAARAGVPFRRFANHTPFVAALPGAAGGRLQTLIRQFEHTVGANGFMLACLRDGPGAETPTLACWKNPIEAVVRFESGGVRRTLRPDGAGEVVQGAKLHSFFLEWDRGTERINVLLEKLTRYAAYDRSATAASADVLLVVTPNPHREAVVWRAVSAVMRPEAERGEVRTTVASLVDQYGPYAPIWRQFGSDARESWPG